MRILATTAMKTNNNPVLDFYAKLILFLDERVIDKDFIKDLAEMGNVPGVSLDIDIETLNDWHNMCANQTSEEMQVMEDIACRCFNDLSNQMRSEAAREVMERWVGKAGIPDDLFIHLRKSRDLGDGYAAITVVTNNVEMYRLFCAEPTKVLYAGHVHLSMSASACDPS